MTFLPIVERELRVRARQKTTYRFRFGAALAAMLIAGSLLVLFEQTTSPGTLGGGLFRGLTGLAFLYCLLEGVRSTADCLSEEKREGTLGLLFLTDLRGYDIVFGKLAATSLNSLYALLASLPALAIPIIVGGVTAGEFWRLVLVLLNTLLLSLGTGLLVSAITRDERRACSWTFAILVLLACLLPLGRWAIRSLGGAVLPAWFLDEESFLAQAAGISPTVGFLGAFDGAFAANPAEYWRSMTLGHSLVWVLLTGASWLLPRCWQDAPQRQCTASVRRHRESANAAAERRILLNLNPVVWLASRSEAWRGWLWLTILVAGGAGIASTLMLPASPEAGLCLALGAWALHLSLAVLLASQACHMMGDARDSGALELLVVTPLTLQQIIGGHYQALRRTFFPLAAMLVLLELIILAGQAAALVSASNSYTGGGALVIAAVIALSILIMDLYAVSSFGLWMGLISRRPGQAMTKTTLYVLLLPQLSLLCCGVLWPVVGLIKNLIFINYGRLQLQHQFRRVVTERFASGLDTPVVPEKLAARDPGRLPPVATV